MPPETLATRLEDHQVHRHMQRRQAPSAAAVQYHPSQPPASPLPSPPLSQAHAQAHAQAPVQRGNALRASAGMLWGSARSAPAGVHHPATHSASSAASSLELSYMCVSSRCSPPLPPPPSLGSGVELCVSRSNLC